MKMISPCANATTMPSLNDDFNAN